MLAQNQIQNQIKKIGMHLSPLSKEPKPPIHKNYINNVYVKFNCASNDKTIILCFFQYMDNYLIKGRFFWLLEIRL
jgi:hypothetical protein